MCKCAITSSEKRGRISLLVYDQVWGRGGDKGRWFGKSLSARARVGTKATKNVWARRSYLL